MSKNETLHPSPAKLNVDDISRRQFPMLNVFNRQWRRPLKLITNGPLHQVEPFTPRATAIQKTPISENGGRLQSRVDSQNFRRTKLIAAGPPEEVSPELLDSGYHRAINLPRNGHWHSIHSTRIMMTSFQPLD
jgi:hypothetical protein